MRSASKLSPEKLTSPLALYNILHPRSVCLLFILQLKAIANLCSQVLEDRSFLIVDSIASILGHAEQIGRSVDEEDGGNTTLGRGSQNVSIPRDLEEAFARITIQTSPDRFILDRGLDSAILYFKNLTKTANRTVESHITYHVAIIDIMMAAWLVKTIRGSREYQVAASSPSRDAFQRQLDCWGMTTERFFDHFEQALQDALKFIIGHRLILPPTPDLLAIFEQNRPTSQQFQQKQQEPIEMEDTSIPSWEGEGEHHGVKEMSA
jgi:hypothetical protein